MRLAGNLKATLTFSKPSTNNHMKAEILSKIEALKVIEETEWDAYKKAEAELDAETMRLQLPPDPLKVLTERRRNITTLGTP